MDGNGWLLFLLFLTMAVAAATLRNLNRHDDRAAIVYAIITLICISFFVWAQHQAEGRAEIEHAAEHRAVQEQVESVREL